MSKAIDGRRPRWLGAAVAALIAAACTGTVAPAADAAAGSDAGSRADRCGAICAFAVACGLGTLDPCVTACVGATERQASCLEGCVAGGCAGLPVCTRPCSRPPTPGDPYGAGPFQCGDDAALGGECGSDVIVCAVGRDPTTGDTTTAVCEPYCDLAVCPPPRDGTAVPVCVTNADPALCELDCTDGQTCPTGMACVLGGLRESTSRCTWLAPP